MILRQICVRLLQVGVVAALFCYWIFIARQHTDARYRHSNSVCPSVRPWRSSIRWKRHNILS